MKKLLGFLSAIFIIIIPFSLVFYLMYSLFSNQSVNILNGGIVLDVIDGSFKLNVNSNLILIYTGVYLMIFGFIFIISKLKNRKLCEGKNKC